MPLLRAEESDRAVAEALALDAPRARAEPSFWSRVGGTLRGFPAAAKEVGATMADTLGAFGTTLAATDTGGAAGMFGGTTAAEQAQAAAAARVVSEGEQFLTPIGEEWRAAARGMRPDPMTATIAEQIAFDAARVVSKAVGYSVFGGPLIGAVATGTDEGMVETEKLVAQGVDRGTAQKAGVVWAVATGASMALPVAGSTLMRTLGLAAVGGPATFVAQQSATRSILEHAGYTKQAEEYDPTDPLGLGLSFAIPAIFGAAVHAGRAVKGRQPTAKPLSEAQALRQQAADVAAREAVTPEHIDAVMAHNVTLFREARAANPPEAQAAAAMRSEVTSATEFKAWFAESKVVDADGAPLLVYRLEPSASDPAGTTIYAGRPETDATPVYLSIKNPIDTEAVRVLSAETGGDVRAALDHFEAKGHDGVFDPGTDAWVALRQDQARSALESMLPAPKAEDALTPAPTVREPPVPQRTRQQDAETAAKGAQDALREFKASGQPLGEFVGRAKPDGATSNLLIGLAEAGRDTVRAKRMLDDFGRTAEAHPDMPMADLAADVVEASRAGREVTPAQQAEALKGDPATAMDAQRATAIEMERPDLPVAKDGDRVLTAREVLEAARREAAEGTDEALGELDAPLIDVAAKCFLTNGA